MKKYRIFLFLLFFGVHFELFAQSSRIWVDGVWDLTEFRDDGSILAYPFDLQPDFIPNSMICTDAGDPLFVYNIWNVKDIRGNTIKGSDSIVPVATIYLMGNVFFQRNDSTYDLIGGYDSVRSNRYHPYPSGYEYDILKYNPMGFYRHSILKTNKGFVMHEKNKLLKRYKPDAQASIDAEYNFRFYKVHRKKDYSYSMVYDHSGEGRNYYDTLVLQIAQVSNGEITKVRRVDLGAAETLFEEPIPIPPSRRVYRNLYTPLANYTVIRGIVANGYQKHLDITCNTFENLYTDISSLGNFGEALDDIPNGRPLDGNNIYSNTPFDNLLVNASTKVYIQSTTPPTGNYQQEPALDGVSCDVSCKEYKKKELSVSDIKRTNGIFEIIPNPANQSFTISLAASSGGIYTSYVIHSVSGEILQEGIIQGMNSRIDIKTLASGVYYITVSGRTHASVKKFVKL